MSASSNRAVASSCHKRHSRSSVSRRIWARDRHQADPSPSPWLSPRAPREWIAALSARDAGVGFHASSGEFLLPAPWRSMARPSRPRNFFRRCVFVANGAAAVAYAPPGARPELRMGFGAPLPRLAPSRAARGSVFAVVFGDGTTQRPPRPFRAHSGVSPLPPLSSSDRACAPLLSPISSTTGDFRPAVA